MHELLRIAILGAWVMWFANNCHEWRCHDWKSFTNRTTSDKKIVIHGNKYIIVFLTRYFVVSWKHNSTKDNHRSLISPLSLRTVLCDVTTVDLWRQTNAKYWYCEVIFIDCSCKQMYKMTKMRSSLLHSNCEYRFFTTGIHGLACKKLYSPSEFCG